MSLSKTFYPLLNTGSFEEMSRHYGKIVALDLKHDASYAAVYNNMFYHMTSRLEVK